MMTDKLRAAAKAALYEFRNAEWDGWNPIIKKLEAALAETTVKESLIAQRPWVGLTDEEIDKWNIVGHESLREFVRSLEAKLREKNK